MDNGKLLLNAEDLSIRFYSADIATPMPGGVRYVISPGDVVVGKSLYRENVTLPLILHPVLNQWQADLAEILLDGENHLNSAKRRCFVASRWSTY